MPPGAPKILGSLLPTLLSLIPDLTSGPMEPGPSVTSLKSAHAGMAPGRCPGLSGILRG